MAFVVVYDACVLHPAPLRDLLLRLAQTGLVQAKWTERILDEVFSSVAAKRPDLDPARLARTRQLMTDSLPDCLVRGYEALVESLDLPDPDDRHVLAAAIRVGAQVIVTWNERDFPAERLGPLGIEAQDPDAFVGHLIDLSPGAVLRVLQEQAADLTNPPLTVADVLDRLQSNGLVQSVAALRALLR